MENKWKSDQIIQMENNEGFLKECDIIYPALIGEHCLP